MMLSSLLLSVPLTSSLSTGACNALIYDLLLSAASSKRRGETHPLLKSLREHCSQRDLDILPADYIDLMTDCLRFPTRARASPPPFFLAAC